MNHFVTVLDLLAKSAYLILIHRPDLVESIFVTLLKSFILLLEEQEILRELFVVFCHNLVVLSEALVLRFEFSSDGSQHLLIFSLPLFKVVKGLLIDLFSFLKDSIVELKFLLIQSVNRFHVFHALLKNLHFFLKLDFLLGLIVGVLSFKFLKLISIFLIVLRSSVHAFFFEPLVLSKELPDLLFVFLNDVISFSQEGLLDLIKLLMVIDSHIQELLAHSFDQVIDVIILLFQSFDVFFIFLLQLVNETADKITLLRDNLFTSLLLNFDVFCKLLAVFFLFKLLPSPVDFYILLMRSNDLCLDLVCSFLPLLFFLNTSGIFSCIGVRSDFSDDLGRFSSDLLKETS